VALFVLFIVGVVVGAKLGWTGAKPERLVLPNGGKRGSSRLPSCSSNRCYVIGFVFDAGSSGRMERGGLGSGLFWPELGFLLCAWAVIRLRREEEANAYAAALSAMLIAAFWLGMALSHNRIPWAR